MLGVLLRGKQFFCSLFFDKHVRDNCAIFVEVSHAPMGMTHTHGGGRRTDRRIYDVSLLILWLSLVLDSCARWTEEDKTATVSLCDLWEWTPRKRISMELPNVMV